MAGLNLAIRFLLELAGIAALAYWGWTATDNVTMRLVLGLGAPALLIVLWSLVVAPRATNPIPQQQRMLIGSGLLEVAALALFLAGQPLLALAFAVLIVLNLALMIALGGPETTLRR